MINTILDPDKIYDLENKLKVLIHPERFEILNYLYMDGRKRVTEIQVKFALSEPAASYHLRILKDQNYLKSTRDGKNIIYSINERNLEYLKRIFEVQS
jgi:ArsR family transcriptional regulator